MLALCFCCNKLPLREGNHELQTIMWLPSTDQCILIFHWMQVLLVSSAENHRHGQSNNVATKGVQEG
jgi:hypothetical protein